MKFYVVYLWAEVGILLTSVQSLLSLVVHIQIRINVPLDHGPYMAWMCAFFILQN